MNRLKETVNPVCTDTSVFIYAAAAVWTGGSALMRALRRAG